MCPLARSRCDLSCIHNNAKFGPASFSMTTGYPLYTQDAHLVTSQSLMVSRAEESSEDRSDPLRLANAEDTLDFTPVSSQDLLRYTASKDKDW